MFLYVNPLTEPANFSEKQLLEMISFQIQRLKPEYIPKAPYIFTPQKPTPPPQAKTASKSKQPQPKPKLTATSVPTTKMGCRLPVPPDPQPTLASRLSPYSPVVATGVLIETIKAGMNAQEGAGSGAGGPNSGQKGKRKVVRVRA
jgi:signal recognition particle subunit SRP19